MFGAQGNLFGAQGNMFGAQGNLFGAQGNMFGARDHAIGCSSQSVQYSRHREITIIELQSLVVFGCTALLFMVGATASTHDREEGWSINRI